MPGAGEIWYINESKKDGLVGAYRRKGGKGIVIPTSRYSRIMPAVLIGIEAFAQFVIP